MTLQPSRVACAQKSAPSRNRITKTNAQSDLEKTPGSQGSCGELRQEGRQGLHRVCRGLYGVCTGLCVWGGGEREGVVRRVLEFGSEVLGLLRFGCLFGRFVRVCRVWGFVRKACRVCEVSRSFPHGFLECFVDDCGCLWMLVFLLMCVDVGGVLCFCGCLYLSVFFAFLRLF